MHSISFREAVSRIILPVLCLCWGAGSLPAEIIYRDAFNGSGGDRLGGRAPEIRTGTCGTDAMAVWIGPSHSKGSRIFADGTMEMPAIDFEGAGAFLPFKPAPGLVYKLSLLGVKIRSGDWVGAGFSVSKNPSGDVRFRDNEPAFWSLIRREGSPPTDAKGAPLNDQTFTGPIIAGVAESPKVSSSSITVLLDTTQSRWNVKWFLDGVQVRSGSFASQPITYVGFGFNTTASVPAGRSSIGSFTVEVLESGADEDKDGLPDNWEVANFRQVPGEAAAAVIARQGAGGDADGDTFSNFEEYVAGSDPADAKSTPMNMEEILERLAGARPPVMDVARSGKDVFLAWFLPSSANVKQVEIYRGDRADPKARTHLATISLPTAVFLDQVPAEDATYWYWLDIPREGGKAETYGPFSTKSSQVWQP